MSGAIDMRLNEEDLKETLEKLVELHPRLACGAPRSCYTLALARKSAAATELRQQEPGHCVLCGDLAACVLVSWCWGIACMSVCPTDAVTPARAADAVR